MYSQENLFSNKLFLAHELWDLNDATFMSDAADWSVTALLTASKVYGCAGTLLLGGYGILGPYGTTSNTIFLHFLFSKIY